MSLHPALRRIAALPSTGETEVLRAAARAAEDAGDFDGALRLVRGLPDGVRSSRWQHQLEAVARLPVTASAQLACWLVHPALRWVLERPAGVLLEHHARLMLTTLGVLAPARAQQLAAVAATDPVVMDAGLFDGGLFSRYLADAVADDLLARVGPVAAWPQHPVSVWQIRNDAGEVVLLRDLWTGDEVRSLRWPAFAAVPADTLLYGRLVPVAGETPLAFALAPVPVDQRCAARVLRARQRGSDPEERLRAVALSRRRAQSAGEPA